MVANATAAGGWPYLALFCSSHVSPDIILKAYDVARALRDAGIAVVGGFQSPIERECLDLLLRGDQPIAICPARDVNTMRVPASWRAGLATGRITLVSPFTKGERRPTAALVAERNRFVVAMARAVLVVHATPGGKVEALAREVAAAGKPLYTLESPSNANVIAMGAEVLAPELITAWQAGAL